MGRGERPRAGAGQAGRPRTEPRPGHQQPSGSNSFFHGFHVPLGRYTIRVPYFFSPCLMSVPWALNSSQFCLIFLSLFYVPTLFLASYPCNMFFFSLLYVLLFFFLYVSCLVLHLPYLFFLFCSFVTCKSIVLFCLSTNILCLTCVPVSTIL